jgi:hypothetical protein
LSSDLPVQIGKLAATLSINGWMSILLNCLVCSGSPRYAQGKFLMGTQMLA